MGQKVYMKDGQFILETDKGSIKFNIENNKVDMAFNPYLLGLQCVLIPSLIYLFVDSIKYFTVWNAPTLILFEFIMWVIVFNLDKHAESTAQFIYDLILQKEYWLLDIYYKVDYESFGIKRDRQYYSLSEIFLGVDKSKESEDET